MFVCTAQSEHVYPYPHVYLYGTISTGLSARHNIRAPGPGAFRPVPWVRRYPRGRGRERTGTARFLPPRRRGGDRSGPGTRRSGRTAIADARPGYVHGPDGQANHIRFRWAGGDLVGLPQGRVRRLPGSERRSLAHAAGHLPGRGAAAPPIRAGRVRRLPRRATPRPSVDMAGSFAVGPALRMTPSRRANLTMSGPPPPPFMSVTSDIPVMSVTSDIPARVSRRPTQVADAHMRPLARSVWRVHCRAVSAIAMGLTCGRRDRRAGLADHRERCLSFPDRTVVRAIGHWPGPTLADTWIYDHKQP